MALGCSGALRGLAGKSESFVLCRRGDRAVCPGERGDEELHEFAQQRPRSEEAGSLMRVSAIVGRASPLGAPRGGGIFYVLYVQIYCVIKVPPPLEASHARRLVTTHFISISAVTSLATTTTHRTHSLTHRTALG